MCRKSVASQSFQLSSHARAVHHTVKCQEQLISAAFVAVHGRSAGRPPRTWVWSPTFLDRTLSPNSTSCRLQRVPTLLWSGVRPSESTLYLETQFAACCASVNSLLISSEPDVSNFSGSEFNGPRVTRLSWEFGETQRSLLATFNCTSSPQSTHRRRKEIHM